MRAGFTAAYAGGRARGFGEPAVLRRRGREHVVERREGERKEELMGKQKEGKMEKEGGKRR